MARTSLAKLPIYSAVSVPEVWRYSRGALSILKLDAESCVEQNESSVLPGIKTSLLKNLIESSQQMDEPHGCATSRIGFVNFRNGEEIAGFVTDFNP